MKVRTRYAPSPTGYFHVGGARTALFNFLFAKHNNGTFIVRNEDTDIERNVEGGIESQLLNIEWLGFSPDESPLKEGNFGPYQQTKKLNKYSSLAKKLIEQKKAYYCFCSKEELDEQRSIAEQNHQTPKYNRHCLKLSQSEIDAKLKDNIPFVIRLKVDEDKNYEWDDLIREKISIPGSAMTDPIIMKSNGIPMYNFAVVIDDYDMKISHVLRGEEHISNTPYQIAIRDALGFNDYEIRYGHLSIIVNGEGKKLSKRDTTLRQFIEDYKNMGYLPQSITNFLCLLGWSPKTNKEVLNMKEMIENFDIDSVSKSPAKFDIVKMNWIANQHIKLLTDEQYLSFVNQFVTITNEEFLRNKNEVLLLFKNQISFAKELDDLISDLFIDSKTLDDNTLAMFNEQFSNISLIIDEVESKFNSLDNFTTNNITSIINDIKAKFNLSGKNLFMPIRIITTLKSHGPELAKTIFLISKKKVLNNITLIKEKINEEKAGR